MITTTEIERNQKAWELVRRLAETEPSAFYFEYGDWEYQCVFCKTNIEVFGHDDDCIWLQARKLVKGE